MDGKIKVSFGIKTSKQANLPKKSPTSNNDVEYISSFDSTCKPLGHEKPKEELVIPAKANKIGKDFLEELKAKREELATDNGGLGQSLEQLAMKELIDEAKGAAKKNTNEDLTVPLPQDTDANEATLEDYENIPVEDFGKAMLRGMGWMPGKGIGKNERVVNPAVPQLRPKGMGLGADKMAVSTNQATSSSSSRGNKEELCLAIGCGAQIVAGSYKGMYGKILSNNEESGRCIVKLEIGGASVSVNENLIKPVSKEEYSSNARVLNADKYKKYKETSDANLSQLRREAQSSRDEMVDHSPERRKGSSSDSRRRRDRSRSPY